MSDSECSQPAEIYLGLGSNVGDKRRNLQDAVECLARVGEVASVSHLYRTEPVGFSDQDWFLNAVVCVRTRLAPREVLEVALDIERQLGRVRTVKNGPRTIDIDILLWGDTVIAETGLTVPHSRLHERLFVLAPLAEIAPDVKHPLLARRICDLYTLRAADGGVERDGLLFENGETAR